LYLHLHQKISPQLPLQLASKNFAPDGAEPLHHRTPRSEHVGLDQLRQAGSGHRHQQQLRQTPLPCPLV
jgi:hypothetical protein